MDSDNDIGPFYSLLSCLNINEDLTMMVTGYLSNIQTEFQSNHQRIDLQLRKNLSARQQLKEKADKHKKLIEDTISNVEKNYDSNLNKLDIHFKELIFKLQKACCDVYEMGQNIEYEMFLLSNRLLDESYEFKKVLFNNFTLLNMQISITKGGRLYMGTLVLIDEYLDDYEAEILSGLIKKGDYKLDTVLKSFEKHRPNLFEIEMNKARILSNRVYLLTELAREITAQARTEEQIHINKKFIKAHFDLRDFEVSQDIEYLQGDVFEKYKKLVNLDLKDNELFAFEAKAFKSLKKLKTLNLSDNCLIYLEQFSISLKKLEILIMKKNLLVFGNINYFLHLVSLKELDLSENSIDSIENHTFEGLTNLVRLDLSSNPIKTIHEDSFHSLINLKELDMSHSELGHLSSSVFISLEKLEKLSLKNGNLVKIVNGLFMNLVNLFELDLSENQIESIPEKTFHGLKKLESLNLEANQISRMHPDCFRTLTRLNFINLNSNRITCFDKMIFARLNNVSSIRLAYNKIGLELVEEQENTKMAQSYSLAVALVDKRLDFTTQLNSMFSAIVSPSSLMQSLVLLNLSHNNLECVDVELLKGLYTLKELNLSDNKIEEVRPLCLQNIRLKSLVLTNNLISSQSKFSFQGLVPDVSGLKINLCGNRLEVLCQERLREKALKHDIEVFFEENETNNKNVMVAHFKGFIK